MGHAHSGSLDYAHWAKLGFLIGLGLFVVGVGGEIVGHSVTGTLPAWENTLFTYAEGVGLVAGFFSPIVFGIVLPLIE